MKIALTSRPRGSTSERDIATALKRIKDVLEGGIDEENISPETVPVQKEKFGQRFSLCAVGFAAQGVTVTAQYCAMAGFPAGSRSGWNRATSGWHVTGNAGGDIVFDSQKLTTPEDLIDPASASLTHRNNYRTAQPDEDPVDSTDEIGIRPVLAGPEDFDTVVGVLWLLYLCEV